MNIRSKKSTTYIKALELVLGLIKLGLCAKQERVCGLQRYSYCNNLGLGGLNTPYAPHHIFHFTDLRCVSYALLGFPFGNLKFFKNIKGLKSLPTTIMLVFGDMDLGTTTFSFSTKMDLWRP